MAMASPTSRSATRSPWARLDGPALPGFGRGIRWDPNPPKGPENHTDYSDDSLGRRGPRRCARASSERRGRIKAFPSGAYSFSPTGEPIHTMYPLPCWQALVDEAHVSTQDRVSRVGGEGLQNAITAVCDSVEARLRLSQAQLTEMSRRASTSIRR